MAWSRPLAFRQILADIQNAACAQQHTAAAEFYFKQQHFSSGPVSFLRRRQSPSFFFYVCILPLSFFFIFFFTSPVDAVWCCWEKWTHRQKPPTESICIYSIRICAYESWNVQTNKNALKFVKREINSINEKEKKDFVMYWVCPTAYTYRQMNISNWYFRWQVQKRHNRM